MIDRVAVELVQTERDYAESSTLSTRNGHPFVQFVLIVYSSVCMFVS